MLSTWQVVKAYVSGVGRDALNLTAREGVCLYRDVRSGFAATRTEPAEVARPGVPKVLWGNTGFASARPPRNCVLVASRLLG